MIRRQPRFVFNDTATTEISSLSLHDALPILALRAAVARTRAHAHRPRRRGLALGRPRAGAARDLARERLGLDRKSTRLNSSHANISYAVFCLKKKLDCHRTRSKSRHTQISYH